MRKAYIPAIAVFALFAACSGSDDGGPDFSVPPAAPAAFGINGSSSACVDFRWDDLSDNETGFVLQRASDAAFTADLRETNLSPGAVRYRDYGVEQGVARHYRILASNEAGRSSPSAAVEFAPPAAMLIPITKIADHRVANLIRYGGVPVAPIQAAKNSLHIAYGHTSHGSQIISGMNDLAAFADAGGCDGDNVYSSVPGLFAWSNEGGTGTLHMTEDMGGYGSAYLAYDLNQPDYGDFEDATRAYLDTHPTINVVMWSWCGGVSHATEDDIADDYLARMNHLETDFPAVAFVYMTGHNDGSGTGGNLTQRNDQIREYCRTGNKWLFDFNDIETYDPDGVCYAELYTDDACNYDFNRNGVLDFDDHGNLIAGDRNWAVDWQSEHTVFDGSGAADWYDCGAAHSQSIVANMKAYAIWWLWARIAGWDGNP